MSSGVRPLRLLLALGVLALTALLVAACGDLESKNGNGDASRGELTTPTTTGRSPQEPPELPPRPTGQVGIDGQFTGSLTDQILTSFARDATRSGLAINVAPATSDESAAFASLCDGSTDVVDASTRITEAEVQACTDNGLEVVDFQIAFDAAVVVTRNERDVGADCVNFDQLRAMFAAGTPVTAWNQINPNFFPIRLTTTGPDPTATDFTFFGQRVLGVPDPTLASFRSDYAPFPRENQIKNHIVGAKDDPGGAAPGTVGIVGFSFYGLFEDKLRPLEIDGQTGDRCVFPSEETISSELYPLERTLRLYTTQRSLNRQEVQGFLRFYLQQAETLANAAELIPVGDAVRKQEIARITDPNAYDKPADGAASEPSPTGKVSTTSTTTTTSESATSTTPTGSPPPIVPGTPSGSGTETAPTTTTTTGTVPNG